MASPAGTGRRDDPAEAQAAVERFLRNSRQPVLLEPGEDHFPLIEGAFELHCQSGRLWIQVWDERRNLVRRILGVRADLPGKLELIAECFPRRAGRLFLLDLARLAPGTVSARERRLSFRERFRRLLARQFPGWKLAELSAELDLEHSLSARYPRALLTLGQRGLAAIGVPPTEPAPDGVLSYGLVWLDYLRRRESRLTVEGLAVFLPAGKERTTCLRLRWLNPDLARWQAWVYSEQDYADPVDLTDYGNLDTRLEPFRNWREALSARVLVWVDRIATAPAVEIAPGRDGSVSLRVRGLEFARASGDRLVFGISKRRVAGEGQLPEIEALAREMARLRTADAPDRTNEIYRLRPEAWLASQIRASLSELDASLIPQPVYGEVPALAGGERGVMDLLAVDATGRLAVIELKASEDIHLPLQALDYWIRVAWHLRRGEFGARGYFPGVPLSAEDPRLILVAPALEFHSTTEIILQWLSPRITVERIGLAVEWRRKVRVAFRTGGRGIPC